MIDKKKAYLQVALPTPVHRQFVYFPPQGLENSMNVIGSRVKVPFQSRTLIGIVTGMQTTADLPYHKLKKAHEILDNAPIFPDDIYQLCLWAAEYYHAPLGEVFAAAMPALLRKGRALPEKNTQHATEKTKEAHLILSSQQLHAVQQIIQADNKFQTFLLDGVTGSGKTEVYLQTISHFLKAHKQILVLVPEISLTPQTIARFKARFTVPVAALHSNLTEKQRLQTWLAAKNNEIKIIIGTRSACFTPFQELGLIIVDEEHDASFKQHDRFRYHARDLVIKRASLLNIPIVLGSATPSLESLLNVERNRYAKLTLTERAGNALLPRYQICDIRNQTMRAGLSETLINLMQQHLAQHQQVLLFLNRRGFAPVLYCKQCSWLSTCKRCAAKLVFHQQPDRLQCHLCDSKRNVPTLCEQCSSRELELIGIGTQRIEQALQQLFPNIPIIRIDRDSTRKKDALQNYLQKIDDHETAILLGTQMLAKGHHFPHVTLVGIIDVDSGFFSADFRAPENMGQLIVQVAGRAGRVQKPGTVVIQTRQPTHPFLQQLIHEGYKRFAQALLQEREAAQLPPYAYFILCRAESFQAEAAEHFLHAVKQLAQTIILSVEILGPVPALIAKRKGYHCYHLIFKSHQRKPLQQLCKQLLAKVETEIKQKNIKWIIDVDPLDV